MADIYFRKTKVVFGSYWKLVGVKNVVPSERSRLNLELQEYRAMSGDIGEPEKAERGMEAIRASLEQSGHRVHLEGSNAIVDALLDDEEGQPVSTDPRDSAYAKLKTLHGQRSQLQSEQMFRATLAMAMRKLGYTFDDIKNFDVRHGTKGSGVASGTGGKYLVGFWLNRGDYRGKISRAKAGTASTGFPATTATAYYVPVVPPLYVPAHLGNDLNPA